MFHNSLPTRDMLLHRQVIVNGDSSCPFCLQQREDIQHNFISGSFVTEVWNQILLWMSLQHEENLELVDHFLYAGDVCKGRKAKKTKYLI